MPQSRGKEQFKIEASLSQQLGFRIPDYQDLAGSDPETSIAIQAIKDMVTLGFLDKNDGGVTILLTLLNGRRKALFATSPHVNEISKMGMQMPRSEDIWSGKDEKES